MCGKENKDDAGFCIHCGAALVQKVAARTEQESPKTQGGSMRTAAKILGAVGGGYGLAIAGTLVGVGFLDWGFGGNPALVFGVAILVGLLSLIGIVGAVQATRKPRVAGIGMLVAGISMMLAHALLSYGSFRPLEVAATYIPLIAGGTVSLFAWRRWGDIKENLKQQKKGGVPLKRCEHCGSHLMGDPKTCKYCGADMK